MNKFAVESKPSQTIIQSNPADCSKSIQLLALDDCILCPHNKIAANIKKVYRQEKPIRLNDVYKLKLIGQCECRYCRANKKLICTCNSKQHSKTAAKKNTTAIGAAAAGDRHHDESIFKLQTVSKSANNTSSQSQSLLSNSFPMFSRRNSLIDRFRQGYRKSKDYLYGSRLMESKTLVIRPIVKLRKSCNSLSLQKVNNKERSTGGVESPHSASNGSGYKCPIDGYSKSSTPTDDHKNMDKNRSSRGKVFELMDTQNCEPNEKRNRQIHKNSLSSYFESFRNTATSYIRSLRRNYPLKRPGSSEKSTSNSYENAVSSQHLQRQSDGKHQMRRYANSKFYTSHMEVEYFDKNACLEGMQHKPSQVDVKKQIASETVSEGRPSAASLVPLSKQYTKQLTDSDFYQQKKNPKTSATTAATTSTGTTVTSNGTILENVLVVKTNTSVVSFETMLNELKLQNLLYSEENANSMSRNRKQSLLTTKHIIPATSIGIGKTKNPIKGLKRWPTIPTVSTVEAHLKAKNAFFKQSININNESNNFSKIFANKLAKNNDSIGKGINNYQQNLQNHPSSKLTKNPQKSRNPRNTQVPPPNRSNRSAKPAIPSSKQKVAAVKSIKNHTKTLQNIGDSSTTNADAKHKKPGKSVALHTVTPYQRAANTLQSWPLIFYTPVTTRRNPEKTDGRKAITNNGTTRPKKKNLHKLHKK